VSSGEQSERTASQQEWLVIDAPVFDDLFGQRVDVNAEGHVVSSADRSGAPSHRIPFIAPFVHEEPMQAAGATLALAWRDRQTLLG